MSTLHLYSNDSNYSDVNQNYINTNSLYNNDSITEFDYDEIPTSLNYQQPLTSPALNAFPPFETSDDSCDSNSIQQQFHNTKNDKSKNNNIFTPKSILKPKPHLNYIVTSSTSDDNLKDAVIFGTQINMINAIKIRQDNLRMNALGGEEEEEFSIGNASLPALPLPCNVYETITIRINTDIKRDYIRRKCIDDNGGYYYDYNSDDDEDDDNDYEDSSNCSSSNNNDKEEYAVIKAELIGLTALQEVEESGYQNIPFNKKNNGIKKTVRFE